MALKKRLQRIGGTSQALLLSKDILAQMSLEDGDTVVMELIGDALVVRRDGAAPVDATRVVLALQAMQSAPEVKPRVVRGWKDRIIHTLRENGPMRNQDLAEEFGVPPQNLVHALRELREAGQVVRDGRLNRLA